ncbi:uncharacterized protein si:dkey-27o4.1 [Thalassophryne amazonica]|uniref:uncharacterized protein si:dkey-27o4.1 n=1 Tax=Thalassophryne amazonica TaxID=390379 RepID=UPI0014715BBA|nr:uncharacterized protein si:dkey-27o4.1 [Thalassophryne amazonica]
MALSQLQCLDENHVNPRTNESKPDFFYSEDQRLALETLLRDGREAFAKFLDARELRAFLSDPELDALTGAVEPYDPGAERFPSDTEDAESQTSLHYWPDMSDTSIPQMDLGWPDSDSYRGVTRTTVHTQPSLDGRGHIKEIVRKMIAQAQKVIAVVMDMFTDVDIFRDLIDAGFKRKVSVYILLERVALPHFLSMCQRANMHAGHLKNLRVRCTGGAEFYTRSCTRVRGRLGHRFMFIDGDKAVSGSYSFTWMSSRLDRHLITVVTGQAVDAFDRLFRFLYTTSSFVNLQQVATDPEPEPEPLPQPITVPTPSAAVARKLYNPKYALVAVSTNNRSHTDSTEHNSSKEAVPETKKKPGRRASKEAEIEAPPLHPGLIDLEKACLISYLPTWPEPDPPSDVIGFINVRDTSRPAQVHLQRSEMYQTSQAIRFSSPINVPKETLPEVATPRQLTVSLKDMQKVLHAKSAEQKSHASGPTSLLDLAKDGERIPTLNTEHNLLPHKPTNKDESHNTATHLNAHTTPERPDVNGLLLDSSTKHAAQTKTLQTAENHAQTNNGLQDPGLPSLHPQQQSSSTMTTNSHSQSSTVVSGNNPGASTTADPTASIEPLPSITTSSSVPHINPFSTTLHPHVTPQQEHPLPSSSTPPVPKPRTVQLIFKNKNTSDGSDVPEIKVMQGPRTLSSTGPLTEPLTDNEPETTPEQQNESGIKAQKDLDDTGGLAEQRFHLQEEQHVGRELLTAKNKVQTPSDSDDAAEADTVNIQEIIPRQRESKTTTKPTQPGLTETEVTATPQRENKLLLAEEHKRHAEHQIISYSEPNPEGRGSLVSVDTLEATKHSPDFANTQKGHVVAHNAHDVVYVQSQHELPSVMSTTNSKDSEQITAQDKPYSAVPEPQQTTKRQQPHSPMTERERRSFSPLSRTPTPDRLSLHTPTSDSHMTTPESQYSTPDFPTPEGSAGYVSPREDVTLSTTSDEYYECSESSYSFPGFDNVFYHSNRTTDDHVVVSADAQCLSAREAPFFMTTMEEDHPSEDKRREVGVTWTKTNVGTERRGCVEANRACYHGTENKGATETEDKDKWDQCQTPTRKNALILSVETLMDEGVTVEESDLDLKVTSLNELKDHLVSAQEKPDGKSSGGETVTTKAALSGAQMNDAVRDTDGHKTSPSRLEQNHQHQQESCSNKPPRPPQPSSAAQSHPCRNPYLNQALHRVLHSGLQVPDSTSSPSRPLTPVRVETSATERNQPKASQHQQGALSQQGPAAQSKARSRQSQSHVPYPKPLASFLHTHSNAQSVSSHNQVESAQEAPGQEDGRTLQFGINLGRLYGLKGLKARISKKSSASAPGHGHTG